MRMHITHRVQELRHLLLPGFDDIGIRMASGGHAKGSGQIQIPFPRRIPDVNAAGAFPHDGPRAVWFDKKNIARFVVAQELERLARGHFNSGAHRPAGRDARPLCPPEIFSPRS